jgi:hypothetical protein
MRGMTFAGFALALGLGQAAMAADKDPCAASMVCASAPQTVVSALQAAGYKAVLKKSTNTGNPMIESAAAGYDFRVYFYECEANKACGSLQFRTDFADDGGNSAALANLWNKEKRFSQMSFDAEDKSLSFSYDVTTVGGLNQKNFADVIDWWATMLGQLGAFFKAHPNG